jgi:hypothetical protein
MAQLAKVLMAGLATTLLAGAGVAQVPEVRQATPVAAGTVVRRASMIMNANVVVQGGATVGRITDFVISDGGYVEYVVVEYDNKYVFMPYQSLRVDGDRRLVQINITRDRFREIPTFTGSNWPVSDQQYLGRVRTVFGITDSGNRGERRDGERQPTNRPDGPSNQPGPPQVRRDVDLNRQPPAPPPPPTPAPKPPEPSRNPVTPLPPRPPA